MGALDLDFGMLGGTEYDEDGHLCASLDVPGIDGTEGVQRVELLTPYGFFCRPLDPAKDSGGKIVEGPALVTLSIGDDHAVMPIGDSRDVAKLPKLRKGGAGLYGGAGEYRSFLVIDGLDPAGAQTSGSITMAASYAKGGAKKSLGLSMNVRTPGSEEIALIHGEGSSLTLSAGGKRSAVLANAKGDAWLETNDAGNVLAGATKVQGSLTAGEQKAARPVALAEPVIAALTALAAAVAAAPGAQGAPAAIQPFTAAIAAKHTKTT